MSILRKLASRPLPAVTDLARGIEQAHDIRIAMCVAPINKEGVDIQQHLAHRVVPSETPPGVSSHVGMGQASWEVY